MKFTLHKAVTRKRHCSTLHDSFIIYRKITDQKILLPSYGLSCTFLHPILMLFQLKLFIKSYFKTKTAGLAHKLCKGAQTD